MRILLLKSLHLSFVPGAIESVIARALRGMRNALAKHTHSTPSLYKINGRRARALALLNLFVQPELAELIEIAA
jgi:hypothetical protein